MQGRVRNGSRTGGRGPNCPVQAPLLPQSAVPASALSAEGPRAFWAGHMALTLFPPSRPRELKQTKPPVRVLCAVPRGTRGLCGSLSAHPSRHLEGQPLWASTGATPLSQDSSHAGLDERHSCVRRQRKVHAECPSGRAVRDGRDRGRLSGVESCPQKRCIDVLTRVPVLATLFGKKVFANNQVRLRSLGGPDPTGLVSL